jgi:hypothetical protein
MALDPLHQPSAYPENSAEFQITLHLIELHISHHYPSLSNWWYTYPHEKYEFVRLDHHPNYWGNKYVPNHQPLIHHYPFSFLGDQSMGISGS